MESDFISQVLSLNNGRVIVAIVIELIGPKVYLDILIDKNVIGELQLTRCEMQEIGELHSESGVNEMCRLNPCSQ